MKHTLTHAHTHVQTHTSLFSTSFDNIYNKFPGVHFQGVHFVFISAPDILFYCRSAYVLFMIVSGHEQKQPYSLPKYLTNAL